MYRVEGWDNVSITGQKNISVTTPDQDLKVLECLSRVDIPLEKYSIIMACGVDSPPYANEVLHDAKAAFLEINNEEMQAILHKYQEWLPRKPFLGKTPLALIEALKGKEKTFNGPTNNSFPRMALLNIPSHMVLAKTNPWSPFTLLTEDMTRIPIMHLEEHRNAIMGKAQD